MFHHHHHQFLFIFITQIIPSIIEACECRSATFGADVRSGELKSPGYPSSYCENLNCKYEIDGVRGKAIHLSIVSFETEVRHDYLEIYQSFMINGQQHFIRIATLTGKDVGWPLYASADGNGFMLRFVTDSSEQFGGFHARFVRVDATTPGQSCPQPYHEAIANDQQLPVPSRGFDYTAGCTYMLNTTDGNAVKLRITAMSSNAKINVYETENYRNDPSTSTQSIADISGVFSSFPFEVVSRTKSIMVILTLLPRQSTPSRQSSSSPLFSASFYRVESPCKCFPKTITIRSNEETSLTSPGYPSEYCDNLDCSVQLQLDYTPTAEGKRLRAQVYMHTFHMEHGADFLHFFDRLRHSTHYLMSRTGETELSRSKYFTFDNDLAELRLVTDATVVYKGFNISLTAIERDIECSCKAESQPSEYTSVSGEFSLNVPQSCQYLDCFFHISRPKTASPSDRIRLLVNVSYEFKGAREEFLEALKGVGMNIIPSHTSDRDVNVYEPGLTRVGQAQMTSDVPLRFWYHLATSSGDSNVFSGGESNLRFNYHWKPICQCGELNLEASVGEWKRLTSPDYPEFYCNSMKCQYLITAPEDHIIVVNITEVSLEPNEDLVAIFNGANVTDKRLELATGIQIYDHLIKGTLNEMTIYFESDVSIANKGFVLFYSAESPGSSDGGKSVIIASHSHFLLYVVLILFLVLCCGFLFVSYQRNLFCFGNRHTWQTTSMVGFSNLAHTANTPTDERSLFP